MAISKNITTLAVGAGRAVGEDTGDAPLKSPARGSAIGTLAGAPFIGTTALPVATQPEPEPTAGAVSPPPTTTFLNSAALAAGVANVGIRPTVFEVPPLIFRPPVNKTTTQIAQGAMNQLRSATPAVIREAIANISNKNIAAGSLLNQLERRTRVGEVLNELANDWSAETKQDFAEAFQMPNTPDKLPVMDTIVSIAILNDPDLRNELMAENTSDASQQDMLENRRIVWQWPQPGTPFTPPYLIMVAVERQDTTQAQNIVQSIIGDLVDFQGFKIPTAAANRLR
jgi:hypothetical protein